MSQYAQLVLVFQNPCFYPRSPYLVFSRQHSVFQAFAQIGACLNLLFRPRDECLKVLPTCYHVPPPLYSGTLVLLDNTSSFVLNAETPLEHRLKPSRQAVHSLAAETFSCLCLVFGSRTVSDEKVPLRRV